MPSPGISLCRLPVEARAHSEQTEAAFSNVPTFLVNRTGEETGEEGPCSACTLLSDLKSVKGLMQPSKEGERDDREGGNTNSFMLP